MDDTTFYRAPSGRLHLGNNCSGGAPRHRMTKVKVTIEHLTELVNEPGRPGLCRCAWNKASRVTGWTWRSELLKERGTNDHR